MPGLKILVIEDNPDDALLLQRALKGKGELEFAESGSEGVRKAAAGRFDVVVLDYRLGDATGTEVMAKLREAKHDLPVIVTSGIGSHFIVARTLALGARDFVSKDAPDFSERLGKALDSVRQPSIQLEATPTKAATPDVSTRAQEIKRIINSVLEQSDLVNTIGIVGADGALIHGRVKDTSGAQDVTAVLAGTVQMMLSVVAGHLGYGQARSILASYEKGSIAMAPIPGNLALYVTSNATGESVESLRSEVEAIASEIAVVVQPKKSGATATAKR